MTIFVTIEQSGAVGELFDSANNNVPQDATPVSDTDGLILRARQPGYKYTITGGALVVSADMDYAKRVKLAEIESARDAACCVNVTALGRTWQADKRSQELLGQAIALAGAGLPLPSVWRDADNGDMTVTALADLLAIAGAMATQTQAAYAASWARKAVVAAATTLDEVVAA